ncbi:MAG: polysaccharide deacetylase family protein [Candidatus Thermoplasmatota archaeon]|nr:polysaccharide deacetylase family protein [Candidatus Thermoplasmatota archaeon]
MKKRIISLVKLPDLILSEIYLRFFQEKNSLIIFNLHGLFYNKKEINQNLVDPQTWITKDQFHHFIEYYLKQNYTFVSPNDILNGLSNDKKYIMLTFDDGYYNNNYALPILKKYQIPALFFISTNHVKQNKCFWWDILYRERIKSRISKKEILYEQNLLKSKTSEEIEKYLIEKFGEEALKPKSDIDRPFTKTELKEFSKEKYVFLGNHTKNHAILTNYSTNEIKSQIIDAQKYIYEITGITPIAISYPNGNYSDEIIKISKEIGIKLGITTEYRKNKLPIDHKINNCMYLGRFDLSGSNNIINQCKLFRSDILIYTRFQNFLNKT